MRQSAIYLRIEKLFGTDIIESVPEGCTALCDSCWDICCASCWDVSCQITYFIAKGFWPVKWIHNILWIRIRIHVNKITKLISEHLLKVKKKKSSILILDLNLRDQLLFSVQTWKIKFPTKKTPKICWLNSALNFI